MMARMGEDFRNRLRSALEHEEEHAACEHLDGAVPYVVCSCGDEFGYHVGHVGHWAACLYGLCRRDNLELGVTA